MSNPTTGNDKSPTVRHMISRNKNPSTIFLSLACIVLAFIAYDAQTKNSLSSSVTTAATTSKNASVSSSGEISNGSTTLTKNATQFRTAAKFCPRANVTTRGLDDGFKSQDGEDKMLMGWFDGLCGGTYIEMGALDGVLFSNSFAFNKHLGWKGLMVEINPRNYAKLTRNRRNELAIVHAGACEVEQTIHWLAGNKRPVGGIWEFTSPSFRELWWRGLTLEQHGQPITCLPMKTIMEKHVKDVNYFDFWSLDVEGAELEVLKSVDYAEVGFGVIFVEADEHNQLKNLAIVAFLDTKGYIFFQEKLRSYWFVNRDFSDIYGEMIHSPF